MTQRFCVRLLRGLGKACAPPGAAADKTEAAAGPTSVGTFSRGRWDTSAPLAWRSPGRRAGVRHRPPQLVRSPALPAPRPRAPSESENILQASVHSTLV